MIQATHRNTITPEERERRRQLREQLDAEKDDIVAEGRRFKAAHDATQASIYRAVLALKAEREQRGLSLEELAPRSGLAPSQLSQLEDDPTAPATLATLERYARALGKEVSVSVVDAST